ncbi:MAG: glycosyltransferase [Nitrospiria bacterium]
MVQLRSYQKALIEMGHQADYNNGKLNVKYNVQQVGYDEIWLFHANMGWTKFQYDSIKELKIPYRLFAIYYPGLYSDTSHAEMKEMIDGAKAVYCLSEAEKKEFTAEFPEREVIVIPNGVDTKIFNPYGPSVSAPKDFVMSAGRFDESKGFVRIIEACKELNIPVMIAGMKWNNSYRDLLRKMWNGAWIGDDIPQEVLASYYRSSKVYVCASQSERNNLCILEAHACGSNVITCPGNRGNEWLGNTPIVDPNDKNAMKEAILNAYEMKTVSTFKDYDWKEIIQMILK